MSCSGEVHGTPFAGKRQTRERRIFMGLYQEEYRRKCCTAEAIAERIESGAVCASGTCLSEPCSITQALGAALRNGTRTGIVHHQTMSVFPSLFLTTHCRANTLPCPGFPQLMAGLLSKKAARMLCRFIIEMSRDNIGNLLIWMFFMRRFRPWTVTAISVSAPLRRSARRWRNRQNIFFWK